MVTIVFSCDNAESEIWCDKTEKYDPSREVFMSVYTSDCHIATLISSGHHSTHFSSLSKNILPSAKSPRSPESRTGSQLRRWVARIIFGINILAMWWRGTRHTGDETLEEAELRGTFCKIYKLFVQSLGSKYYKHVDEKPSLTPRLHDRVRQVFSLPRILATRLL